MGHTLIIKNKQKAGLTRCCALDKGLLPVPTVTSSLTNGFPPLRLRHRMDRKRFHHESEKDAKKDLHFGKDVV